jgi:hypothetical protein
MGVGTDKVVKAAVVCVKMKRQSLHGRRSHAGSSFVNFPVDPNETKKTEYPNLVNRILTSLLFHGTSRGSYNKVGKTVLESLLCHTYDQSIAVRMANVLSYVQHF